MPKHVPTRPRTVHGRNAPCRQPAFQAEITARWHVRSPPAPSWPTRASPRWLGYAPTRCLATHFVLVSAKCIPRSMSRALSVSMSCRGRTAPGGAGARAWRRSGAEPGVKQCYLGLYHSAVTQAAGEQPRMQHSDKLLSGVRIAPLSAAVPTGTHAAGDRHSTRHPSPSIMQQNTHVATSTAPSAFSAARRPFTASPSGNVLFCMRMPPGGLPHAAPQK